MRLTFLGDLLESSEKKTERAQKEARLVDLMIISDAAVRELQEKVRCLRIFAQAQRLLPPEGNTDEHADH